MKKEKDLENKIKKHLEKNGHYHFKVHGSLYMKSGIPDIIACINGHFVGIEVKRPDGKGITSDLQKIHIANIKKSGGYSAVINNYDDYLQFYSTVCNQYSTSSDIR
ncbi:VRR-NUC domain-containing protein [Pseudostreptobacillus hongkongensis]|uniref:VRR-NUC domain-containing protein n=1 Tax=Pseudostreptobacillus hongkongensis TaxID=1162717 RepID=UPI000834C938|nr:VRR-NUC domain-containing protein [Pseudostreptobacillus hongkongensis]